MTRLDGVPGLLLLRVVRPEGVDGVEPFLPFLVGEDPDPPAAFLFFACWDERLGGMVGELALKQRGGELEPSMEMFGI